MFKEGGILTLKGENNDMSRPVEREEFNELKIKVDLIEKEQTVHKVKIDSIEKTLDKISSNTSRTLWTVVAGVIMLLINYFFNPPVQRVPIDKVEELKEAAFQIVHYL